MEGELTALGYTNEKIYDTPIGVALTRKQVESYPLIATNKWISADGKISVKIWDGYATIRSCRHDSCCYKYLPLEEAIEWVRKNA